MTEIQSSNIGTEGVLSVVERVRIVRHFLILSIQFTFRIRKKAK